MMARKPSMLVAAMMLTLIIDGFYAAPAVANDENTNNKTWQFEITPYFLLLAWMGRSRCGVFQQTST